MGSNHTCENASKLLAALFGAPEGYRPVIFSKESEENLFNNSTFKTFKLRNVVTEIAFVKGGIPILENGDDVANFSSKLYAKVFTLTRKDIERTRKHAEGLIKKKKKG